ncbi:MAG: hypothetical protein U9O65_00345 [Thermotogota bacterium]|nr:hypothetical protein [Thermotogota bacterium]
MKKFSIIILFYLFAVCGITILFVIASMDASFVQKYEPIISEELNLGDYFEVSLPARYFEKITALNAYGLRIVSKDYDDARITYKMQIIKQEAILEVVYSGFKEIVKKIKLHFQDWNDFNSNGFPDVVELNESDTERFRI